MYLALVWLLLVASPAAWAEGRCDASAASLDLGKHDAAAGWVEERAVVRVQCTNDGALPIRGYVVLELAAPDGDAWALHNARGDIKLLFGTSEGNGRFVPQRRLCVLAELPPGRASIVPLPLSVRMQLPGNLSGNFQALFPYQLAFRRERPDDCS